ncbi:MAG TPA: hypothetical protein DHW63_04975 [Hyphomonadaceae bacterium]|nr:hypothetical protein [Hyphomonadaceae bacterium]
MNVGGLWSALFANWMVGLVVLAVVSLAAIFVLSGGRLIEALGAMLRAALTLFTTPFLFLRDAIAILRDSSEVEGDYARSRTFMLFRYNRIQYLGVLVAALLTLAGGVTASLMVLYPRGEMERGRMLGEQIEAIRAQMTEAQEGMSGVAPPEQLRRLEAARNEAEAAHRTQADSNAAFLQNPPRQNGAIGQLATARSPEVIAELRGNIGEYMGTCPRTSNWSGYTPADCAQLRTYLNELAERRLREFALAQTFSEADAAFQQANTAAQTAEARLSNLREQLAVAEQARGEVSLFNPSWIVAHLGAAGATLLSTLFALVFVVWFGAILVDFINWLVLLMRSAELKATDTVERAREFRP